VLGVTQCIMHHDIYDVGYVPGCRTVCVCVCVCDMDANWETIKYLPPRLSNSMSDKLLSTKKYSSKSVHDWVVLLTRRHTD